MSNEASTADKKIAGKKTVKKKAARSVVVSPVNVKASGKTAPSKELTAPIGLVWNEDTDKAPKKSAKTTGRTTAGQPSRPMITGTGWPDRPPAPKVNKPGPIHYKTTQAAGNKEAAGNKGASGGKPEPARTKQQTGNLQTAGNQQASKKKEPVNKKEPVRKDPPFSSEKELDALIENLSDGTNKVSNTGPITTEKAAEKPAEGQKTQEAVPGQKKEGCTPAGTRPEAQGQKSANRQNAQGRVLYSPVSPAESHMPISPMQKRPATTQVWEGPIHQIPGTTGDMGYGPKFVRTVVTTTTTTYEPVTADVIRQITSQTSPVALTENVLNQPPAMPPLPGQQGAEYGQVTRQVTGQMPGQASGRQTQYSRGRQPVRQQAGGRPGQQQGRPGQRAQAGQRPPGQPVRPGQPPQGMQAAVRPGAQGQSIIGAMEAQGPAKTQHTGMTQQFADIEKALGLTNDPAKADPAAGINADNLTEAIINNAGVNPAGNPGGINNPGNMNGTSPGNPANNTAGVSNSPQDEQKKSMEYMMLFVEGIIFLIVLAICISIFTKIKKGNKPVDTPTETAVEQTQEPEKEDSGGNGTDDFDVEEAGSEDILEGEQDILDNDSSEQASAPVTGSVDLDNDMFTLRCTNVTVKLDTEGNPAALIYFSFKNKTSEQKAIADVFPISVTQNGEPCDTFAALDEYPEEYYNKDMQISDGSELTCAYAVSLKDAVSPIILTVHDNYDTFADVGSTEIALQ